MEKHTKGPWRAEYSFTRSNKTLDIYGVDGSCLATARHQCGKHGQETREANAHLIAAAPDLLEACKSAIKSILDSIGEDPAKDYKESLADAADCLEGAINKAEGR